MTTLFTILTVLIIVQLVYPFVTMILAQLFGKEVLSPENNPIIAFDFACVITAYRNAAIAEPLIESLLGQSCQNHIIYLVADECPDFDFGVSDNRLVVLRPEQPLRLKVKSIRHAVAHFKRLHDFTVVFDADNLAHPDFLETINLYANAGHKCIQGQRTAKNLDTAYAALDSLGEHYKNYVERRVPYLIGGSAVISGSGMATETRLYKAYLASPEIEAGQQLGRKMLQEDKILQNFVLNQGSKIAYAQRAIVYDEKVESEEAVETQRSRWLFSYFQNLPNSGGLFFRGLISLNFNQLYFGFATLVLPMFLQIGMAIILLVAGLWMAPLWSLGLLAAMAIFAFGILWALWLDEAPKPVWEALWQTPKFMIRQIKSLLKMHDPNKHFKHTEHKKNVSVKDVLTKDSIDPLR